MKVLLKVDVDNLGFAGEVHDVAGGYGRNYLIPQGLAVRATSGVMKQASVWRKAAELRRAEVRAEYEVLAARIHETTLSFTARAGNTGKLYGSITTAQITDELNETLGIEMDRRKVGIEPLRQLGEHKVVVRLSNEFQPELTVLVMPEGEVGQAIAQGEASITEEESQDLGPASALEEDEEAEEG